MERKIKKNGSLFTYYPKTHYARETNAGKTASYKYKYQSENDSTSSIETNKSWTFDPI